MVVMTLAVMLMVVVVLAMVMMLAIEDQGEKVVIELCCDLGACGLMISRQRHVLC